LNRQSMRSLRSIASHPHWANSVETLWLQVDVPKKMPFEEWRLCMPLHFNDKSGEEASKGIGSTPALSDEEIQMHWNNYQRLVEDVDTMLEDGTVRASFYSMFEKCPKLRAIDITMRSEIRRSTTELNKEFQKGVVIPYDDEHPYEDSIDTFIHLLGEAQRANFTPRLLRIGGLSPSILSDDYVAQYFIEFVGKLESLQWNLPHHFDNGDPVWEEIEGDVRIFDSGYFAMLFKYAIHLRTIQLKLPSYGVPYSSHTVDSPRPTLNSIVKGCYWSQLAKFTICLVNTFPGHLVDFFLRHAETLECVELYQIHLIEGKWPGCLHKLAGKLPKLRRFELGGLFTQEWSEETYWIFYDFGEQSSSQPTEYGRRLSQYLLTSGAEFPTPPEEFEPCLEFGYLPYYFEYTEDDFDTEFDEESDEENSDGLDEEEEKDWSERERETRQEED
jgi:hypothetical protein